jgi:hypothetical protein
MTACLYLSNELREHRREKIGKWRERDIGMERERTEREMGNR